jgi:hypothetical protein
LLAILAIVGNGLEAVPDIAPCQTPRFVASPDGVATATCVEAPGRDARRVPTGAARLLFGLRLDPRREDPRALEALPGIGPARALAIAREARRRPFCRPEDLERVAGIGPLLRARLAPFVETSLGDCAE